MLVHWTTPTGANLMEHHTSPWPWENFCHTKNCLYQLSRKSKILLSNTGLEKKNLNSSLFFGQAPLTCCSPRALVDDFVQGRSHGWKGNRLALFTIYLNMFNSRAWTSTYKGATGSHYQSIYELTAPTQPWCEWCEGWPHHRVYVDYEQSLFILGLSSKMPETRKWHALVSCVLQLHCWTLARMCTPLTKSEEKERLLAV